MEARVQLLGPVALYVAGQPQDLGFPKGRCAFAALALECNQPLTADALVTRIWDDPPPHARDNLTSYLSRLRGRLRAAAGSQIGISSSAGAYQLDVDPEAVDLRKLQRFRRQAKIAANSGDDERAARLLSAAETLGNGEALGGVSSGWMDRIRDSLEEERRTIRLDRIDCDLRLGRHADVLNELQRMMAMEPQSERVCAHLMKALYQCGQPSDALRAYREIRAALIEAHGMEPGVQLREIHQHVLDHDLDLVDASHERLLDRPVRPNTLPDDPPDFVGRREALASIANEGTSGDPVKLIVGMPGVGKTTLAVHAAHQLAQRYPDAQLYLNLAGHNAQRSPLTSAQALSSLLRMIGIPTPRIPSKLSDRATFWKTELASLHAVVVLDDPSDAEQIAPLLPTTDSCLVLIASRQDLIIPAKANLIQLDVLPESEARRLFTRIAGCVDDDQVQKAVRLCGLLPLSIQLTASHICDGESIANLLDRLRLDSPGVRANAPKVRTAFELSYRKLTPEQQAILQRLSLHPGKPVTIDAAAALANQTSHQILPVLHTLHRHHLLEVARDGAYVFHDLIRSYTNRLAEGSSVENRQAIRRLLHYYLASAKQADSILHPHRPHPPTPNWSRTNDIGSTTEARKWLEREWASTILLVEYAISHEWLLEGAQLAYLIAKFLEERGLWEEESSILNMALRSARDIGDRKCFAWISLELGMLNFLTGDSRVAFTHANEALAVSQADGDRTTADALDEIGIVQWSCGQYREALAHGHEALQIYEDINDHEGKAKSLSHCGIACWHLGRYDEAKAHFETALIIYQEYGDLRGQATALNNIADVQLSRGYHRDAMMAYGQSQKIFDRIDGYRDRAILHSNMGNIYRYKRMWEQALESYNKALATYRSTGDKRDLADTLNNIGMTYRQMERFDDALVSHEEALEIADSIGSPHERVRALISFGGIYWETLRYSLALEKLEAARGIAREIGDLYQEARVYDELASVVLHTQGPDNARIYWRQALDLFQTLKVPEARSVEIRLHALEEESRASGLMSLK